MAAKDRGKPAKGSKGSKAEQVSKADASAPEDAKSPKVSKADASAPKDAKGAKAPKVSKADDSARGGKRSKEASTARDGEVPNPQKTSNGRRSAHASMAVGVLSAALIAVSLNVLVSRFYKRWDVTSAGLYTLSEPTLMTLRELDSPIDVVVFLPRSDNMRVSVEHMLGAYGAETRQLKARYVDPDQSPAEFLALQKEYGINPMATEDGRVVSETAVVIARGKQRFYLTLDDMVGIDPESGAAKPKLEQALTVGIRNVLTSEVTQVCFSQGHGEPSIDSGAGDGMAELKFRMRQNNYESSGIDLESPDWQRELQGCRVLVLAPQVVMPAALVAGLTRWFEAGGNLLLLLNPVLADGEPRIIPSGLGPLAAKAGITLGDNLLIESSPKLKLTSTGEVFLVSPVNHEITLGLFSRRDDTTQPLVVKVAQSLGRTPDSRATLLATTSDTAFTLGDVRAFLSAGEPPSKVSDSLSGPLPVALASELPPIEGKEPDDKLAGKSRGPRMVVVGTGSVALNDNWRAAGLAPNAAFVTSALSWLASRPPLVDVPEKQSHDIGLNLTEESQRDVAYYVLLYMPLAALLLGGFVMYRRRSTERRSRRREDD